MKVKFVRAKKPISRVRVLELIEGKGLTPDLLAQKIVDAFTSSKPEDVRWAIGFIINNFLPRNSVVKAEDDTQPDPADPNAPIDPDVQKLLDKAAEGADGAGD